MDQVLGTKSSPNSREGGWYSVAEICVLRGRQPTSNNKVKITNWLVELGDEYVEGKWVRVKRLLKTATIPMYRLKKHPPVECPI